MAICEHTICEHRGECIHLNVKDMLCYYYIKKNNHSVGRLIIKSHLGLSVTTCHNKSHEQICFEAYQLKVLLCVFMCWCTSLS